MSEAAELQLKMTLEELEREQIIDFDFIESGVRYPYEFPVAEDAWQRKSGDFDILSWTDSSYVFFEVKEGTSELDKLFYQLAKGAEFLELTGSDASYGGIVVDPEFGTFQNEIDSFGPFFTEEMFEEEYDRGIGTYLQDAIQSHIVTTLEEVRQRAENDYRVEPGKIVDDAEYSVLDAETLMAEGLIEPVDDTVYAVTGELDTVIERYDGSVFHTTPRYDMVTSPYRDSFEYDVQRFFNP